MSTRRAFLGQATLISLSSVPLARAADQPPPFTVVVMDPLAAPLSCPCVKGYAQRDYDKLGEHLAKALGRPVRVAFAETLTTALEKKTEGRADLVIGKDSVVRAEAKTNHLDVTHLAALTGKDGATTQTGLIVVAAADPVLSADGLKDYRIIFGMSEAEEKHGAALEILKDLGVGIPAKPETCVACSDGATKVLDLHKQGVKAATVISSYAQPLLEGCGTIKKGDLRVVGQTDPVPFVAAFVNDKLSTTDRATVEAALLGVGELPALCLALETKSGFIRPVAAKKK